MTLIVEDGTGLSTAESYISVADATAYHAARGNAAWAALASDTVREQLLRKATEYMVGVYRARWAGYRYSITQALDWPRAYVPIPDVTWGYRKNAATVPVDEVPTAVKNACAELALRASAADLQEDLEQGVIREKVGPLEVEYDKASPQRKRYAMVDAMLSAYFKTAGDAVPMVRV